MTAGGNVPYHLRPNKAVDRQLFIDLLTRIHSYKSITNYRYIGFGGPFLDDFRLIHSQLGIVDMTSIEGSKEVMKRQRFNLPLSCITPQHAYSGDFIDSYVGEGNAVVWLDYADPNELRAQIDEFRALLGKLVEWDIVKLTLNSNPEAIPNARPPEGESWTAERKFELRLNALKDLIGDYLPDDVEPSSMTERKLPHVLYRAVEHAFLKALEVSPLKFEPLTSFFYNDHKHMMLTVTGIVLDPRSRAELLAKTGIGKWDVALPTSKSPVMIHVPVLSTRERLFIDRKLPGSAPADIVTELGFNCADGAEESTEMIESYTRFYRHLPYFARIVP